MSLSSQIARATPVACALLAIHAPSSVIAQDAAQPPKTISAPSARRVTVITRSDIQRRNITRLDELFQGLIPGFITMDVGSSSPASWQGRGVASVGAPTRIRVFLNGVELDNPAHISRLNPEYVERIEVTSGFAQGAEDGATGGVIRILTKQGESSVASQRPAFRPTISTLLSAGTENSLYDRSPTLTQRYALNAAGGGQRFGYFLGGGYTGNGNYAPSSKSNGSDALLGLAGESRFVATRMFGAIGRTTSDLPSPRPPTAGVSPLTRQARTKNNSFGGTAVVTLMPWWKQELRAGNSYSDLATRGKEQFGSPGELATYRGDREARRMSYGYVSTFLLPQLSIIRPKFRAGYEHVRYYSAFDSTMSLTEGVYSTTRASVESQLTSYFGTIDLTIANAFALELGARRNRDDRFEDSEFQHNWLPYASAAYAFTPGPLRVTTRGAYGALHSKAVDPTDLFGWPPKTTFTTIRQRMIGSEAGVDLAILNGPQFSVTFFDQHGRDGQFNPLAPYFPRSGGQLISNEDFNRLMVDLATRGVELSAQWSKGPVDAHAAYSVAKTKADHTSMPVSPPTAPGLLQEGDALSDHPRQTGGLWLSYTHAKTSVGTEVRYLGSYTAANYLAAGSRYEASTSVNLTVTHALASGINVLGYVQNLTNTERYASTNRDYARGRRIGLGVRTRY